VLAVLLLLLLRLYQRLLQLLLQGQLVVPMVFSWTQQQQLLLLVLWQGMTASQLAVHLRGTQQGSSTTRSQA
jgi:hypothetical protein